MIMERAVYGLNKQIVGYMIFKEDVKDPESKEEFIGFKRCLIWKIIAKDVTNT